MPWIYTASNQLDEIERKIDRLLRMERKQMADEAALDQAIADLGAHIDELQAAAQSIIDKVSTMPNAPDLSDEIETLQGLGSRVTDTTTEITNAVTPVAVEPPPDEPPPVEESPPAEEPS